MNALRRILAPAFTALALAACADIEGPGSQTDDLTESRPICNGPDAEPNDGAGDAQRAPSSNDCDSHGGRVTGELAGSSDADWFAFEGYDAGYCRVDPAVTFDGFPGARICMFFECVDGELDLGCPDGTKLTKSVEGLLGCCGDASFRMSDINCEGTTADDLDVYLRVDGRQATTDACHAYGFTYSF